MSTQHDIDQKNIQQEISQLAQRLQWARRNAGDPSYRELARHTKYSISSIWRILNGQNFPRWAFTESFLRSCNIKDEATLAPYREQWMKIAQMISPLDGEDQLREDSPGPGAAPSASGEECPHCGALVLNPLRHQAWHATYTRRNAATRPPGGEATIHHLPA